MAWDPDIFSISLISMNKKLTSVSMLRAMPSIPANDNCISIRKRNGMVKTPGNVGKAKALQIRVDYNK